MKESTYIPLTANRGQEEHLANLLIGGAALVAQTEPNTLYWYALRSTDGSFGIFDFFPNEIGREEHFAGQVAAALYASADSLVADGWDEGVIANVTNGKVLSAKVPYDVAKSGAKRPTQASYILLTAKAGQDQALQQLLTGAAQIIRQTEPNTLLWTALQLGPNSFAIFDTFTDSSARESHFSGKVAAALKSQANALVEGGWEKGVLDNIHNFEIIADASSQSGEHLLEGVH